MRQSETCGSQCLIWAQRDSVRHVGQVGIGSYEHICDMVMVGHMSIEVIRAFILKALMPLVFIRTFPSSLIWLNYEKYSHNWTRHYGYGDVGKDVRVLHLAASVPPSIRASSWACPCIWHLITLAELLLCKLTQICVWMVRVLVKLIHALFMTYLLSFIFWIKTSISSQIWEGWAPIILFWGRGGKAVSGRLADHGKGRVTP